MLASAHLRGGFGGSFCARSGDTAPASRTRQSDRRDGLHGMPRAHFDHRYRAYARRLGKLLVERMVAAGAEVPKNQIPMVTEYLTKALPEGNVPKAVIIPGSVKVTFKEWTVPTIGSRPHDPLATHDGYLWYSGQYANVLGRVDTKTGEIKEFHPPTKGSGPHGLVEDKDGKIWFTANLQGIHRQARSKERRVLRIQAAARRERTRTRRCSITKRVLLVHRAECQ